MLKLVSEKGFLDHVKEIGAYLKEKLIDLSKKYLSIKEVRGVGLLLGAEMDKDPKELVAKCKEEGLLLIGAGSNTIRFMPPLIVSKKDCDSALEIFEKCL